jgi:hypothetical protein
VSEKMSNVEFAHRVHEQGHHNGPPPDRRAVWVGIAEAVVLSIVAVATAWSGYQAARWVAVSTKQYALASRTTVLSQEKATLAGQDRLYDITTFNSWIAAKTGGDEKLAAIYQRRFRTEYVAAFAAWQKLDPLNNPSAPAGPIFMLEISRLFGLFGGHRHNWFPIVRLCKCPPTRSYVICDLSTPERSARGRCVS